MEPIARAWARFCLFMMRTRHEGSKVWRDRHDAAELWLADLRQRRQPP